MKISKLLFVVLASMSIAIVGCKKEEGTAEGDKQEQPTGAEDTKVGADTPEAAKPAEGAGTAAAAPTMDSAEWDKLALETIAYFEALSKAAEGTKGDCTKQAEAMSKVIDENKGLIDRAKKVDENAAMKKQFEEKYGEKAKTAMMGLMGNIKDCAQDPAMQAAMKKMVE